MTGLIGKYGHNYKSLLKLALPIIIGQLGGIITGLADTIMVGQHSTAELAASSFVNNVLNTFIIFGTGFSFVNKNKKLFIVGTFALLSVAITYHSVFNMLVQSDYRYFGAALPVITYVPFVLWLYNNRKKRGVTK